MWNLIVSKGGDVVQIYDIIYWLYVSIAIRGIMTDIFGFHMICNEIRPSEKGRPEVLTTT